MTGRSRAHDHRAAPGRVRSIVDQIARWSRLTTIAFAVIAVALLVLSLAVNRFYDPQVRQYLDAERVVRQSNAAMQNQEANLRSYLLSGDEQLLRRYQRAVNELRGLDIEADRLLASSDALGPLLDDVRAAEAAWTDTWVAAAIARGRDRAPGPNPQTREQDALLIEGKELFDGYRAAHDVLMAGVIEHRDDALAAERHAVLVAAALALLVTVVLAAGSVLNSRRLRDSMAPPLAAISTQLARIAQGDFSPAVPVGPSETHEMIEGLNATARALAEAHAREHEQAEATRAQNHQLAQVLRVAREIAGNLNLGYVLQALCTAASSIAGDERVIVWLCAEDGPAVEPHVDSAGPELEPVGLEPVAPGEGTVGRAARYGNVEAHGEGLPEVGGGDDESVAMPMVVGAEVIGVIEVRGRGVARLPRRTMDVLEALAVQAASGIASARLHERTEELARTDALTRLPNRRVLESDLDAEVAVTARYGRPLAFAMLDVDHFKAYNDTLGHQAADIALQELARLLARGVRATDTVYRYGGEEIAILMRETTSEGAREHAERLRGAVQRHFAGPDVPRPVTVSIGVAVIPEHARSATALVAAADSALYEAKRAGRNRVGVAPPLDDDLASAG